ILTMKDYRNGLCWVLPFGYFEGFQLVFPQLNAEVQFVSINFACFKWFDFTGYRCYIVFFTHHSMFFFLAE
ncbi:MAG: hypothetical protein ACYCVV_20770, partial [Acidimicrobiales bacterium]